uniref:Oxidative stress-responsive serine-rich protein 1 n=1 Tax=Gasterosteus aculeatus aculeatus TaxID=481459 RepID=G3N9T0_GASAC|nr:oxidative stress-responsive serine-rich protein 1 [Gasterosteus aculeatus aculeatus]
MEAGGKDCEEDTLQTAFKKLRVDAESLPGAVSVSEALAPRATSRASLDAGGAKPKLCCPKDNWHGCMRKPSRGATRTQRRRRSKSPILHPPKFTYCSTAPPSALSTPGAGLKHQRLDEPPESCPPSDGRTAPGAAVTAQKELSPSGAVGHLSPLVFGSCGGYERRAAVPETALSRRDGDGSQSSEESDPEKSAGGGAESAEGAPAATRAAGAADAADFRALSERHGSVSAEGRCPCAWKKSCGPQGEDETTGRGAELECRCGPLRRGWRGVEVYSFTGLRDVISECERSLPGGEDAHRTLGAASSSSPPSASSALSSGSPRSCSEQARAFVDDITIEDLSGYMEYYLYIPKKMSHMAEMMYT